MKDGVQYVVDNAEALHADADDITLLGCSAGGYLAARAAFETEGYTYAVKNLVDFFGATQWMTDEYLAGEGTPEASWIGADIASMAEELDPLTYLDEGDVVRVWISHGTGDTTMDIGQSEQFCDGCTAVLGEENVHYEPIEGANHEGAEFYTAENFALVDAFITQ